MIRTHLAGALCVGLLATAALAEGGVAPTGDAPQAGAERPIPRLDPRCEAERTRLLVEAGSPGILLWLAFEALEDCVAAGAVAAAWDGSAQRGAAR